MVRTGDRRKGQALGGLLATIEQTRRALRLADALMQNTTAFTTFQDQYYLQLLSPYLIHFSAALRFSLHHGQAKLVINLLNIG
ncbi:unnamed protein product [Nezara viridula]|uniref:Uncharacterized protein n=1 Tax=Nezara viridula TaxID=85310 RepID=A0A9P0E4M2_NEZVI|nr:unnamed protein product [Nezara viridula]